MRLAWGLTLGVAYGQYAFSDLLGRIQQTTLKFDQQAEDVKNREQEEIRNIEMRERDIDRAFNAEVEKFHWKLPLASSFLEKRRPKKHSVKAKPIAVDENLRVLEETEKQRELAEKNFLAVEKDIASLPEKLLRTKERKKNKLSVPLDDDDSSDDDN
jgi:hypothetical protein